MIVQDSQTAVLGLHLSESFTTAVLILHQHKYSVYFPRMAIEILVTGNHHSSPHSGKPKIQVAKNAFCHDTCCCATKRQSPALVSNLLDICCAGICPEMFWMASRAY